MTILAHMSVRFAIKALSIHVNWINISKKCIKNILAHQQVGLIKSRFIFSTAHSKITIISLSYFNIKILAAKPYACDQCSKTYTKEAFLKAHNDAIHLGILPHACRRCDKRFASAKKLKIHSNEHGCYVCDQCNVAFNRLEELNTHKIIIHRAISSAAHSWSYITWDLWRHHTAELFTYIRTKSHTQRFEYNSMVFTFWKRNELL